MEDVNIGDKSAIIPPPEYCTVPSSRKSNRKLILLGVYACAVTLALVFLSVWGPFQWTNNSKQEESRQTISVTEGGAMVELDDIHGTETFFSPGTNASVAVMDFHKGSLGMYVKEHDLCLLATGINFQQLREAGSDPMKKHGSQLTLGTDSQDVNPDLLPSKMASLCAEKRVMHLGANNNQNKAGKPKASRIKRSCYLDCATFISCNGGICEAVTICTPVCI